MTQVSAQRLRLRSPSGWAARTQSRVEEALRLAAPDDERLIVLRRLDLGRLPVTAAGQAFTARTADRMAALAARAVHAATPGAADRPAVWFRSAAEARLLLLAELAAGRTPFAWFWRLAVPDWRDSTLVTWLGQLIADAEASPERAVELAQAFVRLAGTGLLDAVVAALAQLPALVSMFAPAASPPPPSAAVPAAAPAAAAARAWQLLHRHAAPEQAVLCAALMRLPPDAPAARWLARMVLLAAGPELAAQPPALAATAEALLRLTVPPPPRRQGERAPRVSRRTAPERREPQSPEPSPPGPRDPSPRIEAVSDSPSETPPQPTKRPDAAAPPAETLSGAAGIWLLVRPLHRMGIADWLDRHPDWAADGFARALLRHIAERMRAPPDDAVFDMIRGRQPLDPADDWSAALAAWRIGLDRWLRRTVRRRLADIVHRRGWLTAQDTGLVVRFRVDAADIACRRHALDVDPGWVPWLGLSVRYRYADEAAR
jgi:hypothetical protein